MAKKTASKKAAKGRKRTPSGRAGGRAAAGAAARKRRSARRKGKLRARAKNRKPKKGKAASPKTAKRVKTGGTGREETLAQTPATGRSVKGPTNPMPTKRSTGTAAGAGSTRRVPGLERARRQLREIEETVPTPPSSLDMNRQPSAARSGRAEMADARREHTETSPVLTGGDVDADWEEAYSVGDEAPGGDNPTPDQDRVDDIGRALGIQYEDNEELKGAAKIEKRDRNRWELDPASAEDYIDRDKE